MLEAAADAEVGGKYGCARTASGEEKNGVGQAGRWELQPHLQCMARLPVLMIDGRGVYIACPQLDLEEGRVQEG